jgi:hypothetical protein
MKKVAILLVVVIMLIGVMAVPFAGASPDAGKGCYCHKMSGQAAVSSLHGAWVKSGGQNAKARPIADCGSCHM